MTPRRVAKRSYEEISNLDPEERDRVVMELLPQVHFIARRIHQRVPHQVPLEDLVSAGVVGLMEALHHYDARRNVPLPSYAKIRIHGAILDSLRQLDWGSRDLRRKAREVERAQQRLRGQLGTHPSEDELANELGVELSDLRQLLYDLRALNLGSLQELTGDDGAGDKMYNYLPHSPEKDALHQCLHSELLKCLAKAIGELPPRERQLLALYYVEELTFKEVGEVVGVGEARVCQLHSAALMRLRARLSELLEGKGETSVDFERAA